MMRPPASGSLCALLLVLVCGCGRESASPPGPKGPNTSSAAVQVGRTAFTEPVTAEEVEAFRNVVAQLPGGRVPEFATASSVRVHTANLSPAKIIDEQRKRFRTTLDPFRQAQLWKIDPLISEVLDRSGIEAEAFAMLMIRLSAGWAAAAFVDEDGHTQCQALKNMADRRIEELRGQILAVDTAAGHEPEVRQSLADALVETVALSEFLGLLTRVPAETVELLLDRRELLRPLMPPTQPAAEFERHLESTARVVPAGYITP